MPFSAAVTLTMPLLVHLMLVSSLGMGAAGMAMAQPTSQEPATATDMAAAPTDTDAFFPPPTKPTYVDLSLTPSPVSTLEPMTPVTPSAPQHDNITPTLDEPNHSVSETAPSTSSNTSINIPAIAVHSFMMAFRAEMRAAAAAHPVNSMTTPAWLEPSGTTNKTNGPGPVLDVHSSKHKAMRWVWGVCAVVSLLCAADLIITVALAAWCMVHERLRPQPGFSGYRAKRRTTAVIVAADPNQTELPASSPPRPLPDEDVPAEVATQHAPRRTLSRRESIAYSLPQLPPLSVPGVSADLLAWYTGDHPAVLLQVRPDLPVCVLEHAGGYALKA